MITMQGLQEAIAECQGERNPDARTCMKLAAYYTIMDHVGEAPGYSYASAPSPPQWSASYTGDSEFGRAIDGMDASKLIPIMDELMSTLKVLNPKLYDGVLRRIRA